MAILVSDPVAVAPGAAAASFSIDVSDIVTVADDYVVVVGQCSATSGTLSETSGGGSTWTVTTLYVASGCRMFLAYTKASGSSVSSPTISLSAGTGLWQAAKAHVRDADATTFNAGTITTSDGGNATSAATGALTPSSNNALVLYFAGNRFTSGVPCPLRFASNDVVGEVLQETNDGTTFLSMVVGTVQQTTAAASAKTFYNAATARCGAIVLPIKNKTAGGIARHAVPNITRVAWLGDFGTHDGVTLGIPDNATDTPTSWDGSGAINGITVSNFDMTVSAILGPKAWGKYTGLAATLSTASAWVGRKIAFGSAMDFSGKMFSVETYSLTVISSQMGAEGAIIAFRDSSGYWEAFQLVRKAAWIQEKVSQITIDVENATPYASGGGGALNWADIVSATAFIHRAGSSATSRTVGFRNLLLVGKTTLVGGSSGRPQEITYLDKALNGWGFVGLCSKQGPSISIKSDVQIGDGTFPTYYDASASMLSTDSAYNVLTQFETNIPASKIDVVIKAASGDTIYDRASAMSCGQLQNYTFDATSHASATYSLSGKTFVGVAPTLLAGETFTGATFSDCGPVATKGANLTNCTISDTRATSSQAAVTVDGSGSTLDGCTIDVSGTSAGYHLELGTAVTAITLTDQVFTGTPGTDKVHVLKTTGTVTITISGTTTLAAGDVTTEGATVAIDAPTPTLDATVLSGSRVVLYNDTTAAELDNTAPAGTSWSKVITSGASSGDTLTLHVFKEGYEEFSTSFIYAGIDNTLLVSQSVHASVASLRTELGITDYTTITEFALDITGTVEIDADDADGSTTKARLAIWYNGVLTTENGARYLRGAISVLSTAAIRINTSVLDLKIENISVTYGLNFTDTERRLYRDDGAAIYAAASAAGSIQNDYSGVPDTVTTSDQSLNLATAEQAIDNKLSSISSGVWTYVVTGSTTAVQMMRGFAAMLLGKVSGAGTGAETFRDIADTKDVATFMVDSSGNRTAVTRDLT